MSGIDFSHVPCIYWDDNVKVSYLQRRIIVYSILYYELDKPILSDKQYDSISQQLVNMMNNVEKSELEKSKYWYCMYDFDGSTGFDLYSRLNPEDQHYLMELANMILSIGEKKKNDKK